MRAGRIKDKKTTKPRLFFDLISMSTLKWTRVRVRVRVRVKVWARVKVWVRVKCHPDANHTNT